MKSIKYSLLGLLIQFELASNCCSQPSSLPNEVDDKSKPPFVVDDRPIGESGNKEIAGLINYSDSSEILNLAQGSLEFLKVTNPDLVKNKTKYETIADKRLIKNVRVINFEEKKTILESLTEIENGKNNLTYNPTLAIRVFKDFEFSLILISIKDRQAKIFTKKSPNGKLVIIPSKFCSALSKIAARNK